MEALLSFTAFQSTPPSLPRPSLPCFHLNCSSSSYTSSSSSFPGSRPNRKQRLRVRLSAAGSGRDTLSSSWDLSASSSPAGPWMSRFEELDTTNMLLKQRIVFLGSQVDTVTADFIISQLLFLDAEDQEKDIKLFINSPGGSVTSGLFFHLCSSSSQRITCCRSCYFFHHSFYTKVNMEGMGIYDAMKLCKADVSTVCLGLAASMGAFLLAAGTKGKRFCMPNSRVMIHQPLGTAGGKATEMGLQIREMAYHRVKMNKIFSRITGKPEKQIEMDTDRDFFMSPWEAKDYGLIDAVIDDGKPGLVAPVTDLVPPPKTRIWDLWKVEGSRKAKKNLPSEQKSLQNGYSGKEAGDGEKGSDQDKEAAAPV